MYKAVNKFGYFGVQARIRAFERKGTVKARIRAIEQQKEKKKDVWIEED